MSKLFIFILSFLLIFINLNCDKLSRPIDPAYQNPDKDDPVYFYLSDFSGMKQTIFDPDEDIFFHFGIINYTDTVLDYYIIHGGPIVSFQVYRNEQLVGTSDDGYGYPTVIVPGELQPGDTLKHSVSWYSNPYHHFDLQPGNYKATIVPYVHFEYLFLYPQMDSVYFEIK